MDDNRIKLISFLKELTISLESDNIHPKQIKSINEFYNIHSFLKETIKNNLDTVSDNMKLEDEVKDFAKFLTTLWFLYCSITPGFLKM